MRIKHFCRYLLISLLLMLFFLGYSWFFRAYLEPQQYVDLAREHITYDPYFSNWNDPDFELIWRNNRPLLRFVFYNDRPRVSDPVEVYIDPFTKNVTTENYAGMGDDAGSS